MDTSISNTQDLVVNVNHFNWSIIDGSVTSFRAQANLSDNFLILSIFDTNNQPHNIYFPLGEGARQVIIEMIQNSELQFLSILCEDSTFTGENIETTESMHLLALGTVSLNQFYVAIFATKHQGESAKIAHEDFCTLCFESSPDGFQVSQGTAGDADDISCFLSLFDVASSSQSEFQQIELTLKQDKAELVSGESKFEINYCTPFEEIFEILTNDKLQIAVLLCANLFLVDQTSLDDLGSIKLLAVAKNELYFIIAATEGCEGRLYDREGFVYRLTFYEEGLEAKRGNALSFND